MTAPAARIDATVRARRAVDHPDYCEMDLEAGEVAARAAPGQFVHLRLPGVTGSLLRRPFSIAGADGGVLTLLFKKVGRLTRALAGLPEGAVVDVLGPLGSGYRLDGARADLAVLVAGGYGVAPLLLLARELRRRDPAEKVVLVQGARSAPHLIWKERLAGEPGVETRFATDDGSVGERGTAVDVMEGVLKGRGSASARVFACGPMPMLAAVAARSNGVPAQVAVENQMGCGIGVCLGCVLPAADGSGHGRYVRICCDGPVFDAGAIDWGAAA